MRAGLRSRPLPMIYQLLKNSTRGKKGQYINITDVSSLKILAANGIIRLRTQRDIQPSKPAPMPADRETNNRGPDVLKVQEPEVKKRRGRPRKSDASVAPD